MVDWDIRIDSAGEPGTDDFSCPAYITLVPGSDTDPLSELLGELRLLSPDGADPLVILGGAVTLATVSSLAIPDVTAIRLRMVSEEGHTNSL